ncbi:uncharacterized protein DSM5745_09903 [Aspergillus mulundensis]|uniref:Initiation-specific alpha-1,6-mannosyltransferase n=1 Tax=Aspergillus mulundensis TaxID=1810919 RepID=A0A3D8QRR7_9EURO|nr:Uncharacterized protein DSM5745_09903 [Aspergillus mulundensis]RDW64492.1 Uncharacterized protein DSM5745_09903 [Aspergillus mulundensis]
MTKSRPSTPFAPPPIMRRRLPLLIAAFFLFFLFRSLLPVFAPNPRRVVGGKWLPDYEVQDVPRYLHHSPYRDAPDHDFERRVSEALSEIEENVLSGNGDRVAEERIWQIRLGDTGAGDGQPERGADSLAFTASNGEWAYTLVTDDPAKHFITEILAAVPELNTLYDSYPYHVMRSDLLRYLLLWYYGGYYADSDVYPAKSIKECPSLAPLFGESINANISLAVGIEIDEPHASPQLMRDWHWIRTYGLIQYTFYAPQRFSPLLREVIVRVLSHTRQHNRYSLPFVGPQYNEKTILEVTGPGVFTDAILDALSDALPTTHSLITASVEADKGINDLVTGTWGERTRRLTWAPFHKIHQPVCVDAQEATAGKSMGGVCVLPINAWGNGQRHSGAEGFGSPQACINHRFGGSWKKDWWHRHFG